MEQKVLTSVSHMVNTVIELAQLGNSRFWVDYDKEADVLYINFGRPQKADNAVQGKDGIIRRTRKNKLVGLTVLGASQFSPRHWVA